MCARTVLVLRRHLKVVAALRLPHEVARQRHVFLLGQILVVLELRRNVERIPLLRRNILPLDAVAVRLALCRGQVVRHEQLNVRVFRHAEIVAILAEKVRCKVLADVNIVLVVCALALAVRLDIQLLPQCDNAVNQVVARSQRVVRRLFRRSGRRLVEVHIFRQCAGKEHQQCRQKRCSPLPHKKSPHPFSSRLSRFHCTLRSAFFQGLMRSFILFPDKNAPRCAANFSFWLT